ncbi:MAG: hypothetical protein GEU73_04980 [Chloroflexi bacterium]|nr:hypothetical protein [Chloroflexota bacterium]
MSLFELFDPFTVFEEDKGGGGGSEETPKKEESKETKEEETEEEILDLPRAKEKIAKANSEAANLRKRLKEAEAAEGRLKEIEDAKKSDLEKAAEKTKSLEDKATKAETDLLRLRVALRKGLTETQAKRLIGSTEEELEADADELLESFKPSSDGGKGGPNRRERLKGGGDPTEEPVELDPKKLAGQISRD